MVNKNPEFRDDTILAAQGRSQEEEEFSVGHTLTQAHVIYLCGVLGVVRS